MPFSTLSGFEHAAEAKQREQSARRGDEEKHTETMLEKAEQNAEWQTNRAKLVGEKKKKEDANEWV